MTAYIEITPFDVIKYELGKPTGYIKVDRPQETSSSPPTLYGFIPQTYCAERPMGKDGPPVRGDGDPLDICVISERPIDRADITMTATVVGGLQMLDGKEADDKIISVLVKDPVWGGVTDADQLPQALIDRLAHYFETYKLRPNAPAETKITARYGAEQAHVVVRAALDDYQAHFGSETNAPGHGDS